MGDKTGCLNETTKYGRIITVYREIQEDSLNTMVQMLLLTL